MFAILAGSGHFPARGATFTSRIEKAGTHAYAYFGSAVSGTGDVTGDGTLDFAVSTADAQVTWFAGSNGSTYRVVSRTGCFGQALAPAGDLDGDGLPDLLVGDPCAIQPEYGRSMGSATILSGGTGESLRVIYGAFECVGYGAAVAGGEDVSGDGTPDILLGAPVGSCIPPGLSYYELRSGADGHFMTWRLDQNDGALGAGVAFIGDLNGDGREDYLVGDPRACSVDLLSGASGQTIRHFTGSGAFGSSVASLGDIDGDGRPDFAVGAPTGGWVGIYSGGSGALIRSLVDIGYQSAFGSTVVGIGDVSGDGWPDLVVGAPGAYTGSGAAYVYSARDGVLLYVVGVEGAGERLGSSLARIGDLDGDGRSEFVVGAPYASIGGRTLSGRAVVYGVSLGPPLGEARNLQVEKSLAGIELSWEPPEPGCGGSDYGVYRGTLASLASGLYDHTRVACTTNGSTQFTIPPVAGTGEYFLVSTVHGNEEGGLGTTSRGAPRPLGTATCRPFHNASACH